MSLEDSPSPPDVGRPCVVGACATSPPGAQSRPTLPGPSPERAAKIRRRQAIILTELLLQAENEIPSGRPLDALLAQLYRQHHEFGSRDRRLFSTALFAWFRWRGWLIPTPGPTLAGICYALALEGDAATHEVAASLGIEAGLNIQSPVISSTTPLAARAEAISAWGLKSTPPPLTDLVPAWALDVLGKPDSLPPAEFTERLVTAFQSRPPSWIRIRSRFHNAFVSSITATHTDVVFHPRLPQAAYFPTGLVLRQQKEWVGQVEMQDIAAQAVGHICAPAPHSRWWDVCAGAGGKTLHLADLMNETGVVLATDIREEALDECRRRITAARIPSVRMRSWNGEDDPQPGTLWDGVLLDVPCSGIGTWHRNPDARWRINADTPLKLAHIQRHLIEKVADKVKPGGYLVYATCTLTEMENNGVVSQFLGEHPEFQLDPFTHPLTGAPTNGQVWIWPCDGPACNGMFISRLIRRK